MDKLLCGIDIGGTKSFAVLFDKNGCVAAQRISRGSTPIDVGTEEMESIYRDAVLHIFEAAGERGIEALYISAAAYEQYPQFMDEVFARIVTEACAAIGQKQLPAVRIEPDGLCLISGELGHADGAGLICGTGSSLFVRRGETSYRVGGWGHYFGSVGSGFQLARMSIQAAYKAYDGIIGPTVLTDLLSEKAGCPIRKHYAALYRGGRSYVASFADCLFKAVKLGDETAKEIFCTGAEDLARVTAAARRKEGRALKIVMNGGIFFHYPEYVAEVIRRAPQDLEFLLGSTPPIYGCAVEAMHLLGSDALCGDAFKANFIRTLRK